MLFVQDADAGNIDDDQLTLVEVSPNTGWFTDRPVREAGQMATADFVSLWDEGNTFDIDPPNADFTCQAGGDTVNVVVELSSPVVNGRTLSYDVVQVGDTPTGDFDCAGNAHLFIDSVGDPPIRVAPRRPQLKPCASAQHGPRHPKSALSLQNANLADCDLGDADLTGANLNEANLRGANLAGANLRDAKLFDAKLNDANLAGANLTGADLRSAQLTGANLNDANLNDANLTGADLRSASLGGVIGWDTVKGKDTIVGLDTAFNVPND